MNTAPIVPTANGRLPASRGREGCVRSSTPANVRRKAQRELERRAGIEPASAGFADLRVSRFATGAIETSSSSTK